MHQNACLEKSEELLICRKFRMTGKPSPAEQRPAFPGNSRSILLICVFFAVFFPVNEAAGKKYSASFVYDQLKREYYVYVPSMVSGKAPVPLLMVLHGKGGNGESMILLSRKAFNKLAEKEGFIVVYPDGFEKNWNDGRKDDSTNDRAHRENIDDVGFLSALMDTMIRKYSINQKKIYVTGMSNGAIMAYRLACELSHRVTAIAPVTGNIPPLIIPGCSPSRPVPVLAINGTDDPVVPYGGGMIISTLLKTNLGKVMSTEASVRYWALRNGCSPNPVISKMPDTNPKDGTRVTVKKYLNGKNGAEVILYEVTGGGHTWPGGIQYLPKKMIGRTCRDFDAAEVIWSFFDRHELQNLNRSER
jgi:polyhydroxybutyrate depolymerase